jgi:hypothetical protein
MLTLSSSEVMFVFKTAVSYLRKQIGTGFDGKTRRKEPLGRPRQKWKDGIRMYLKEIGWGCREDQFSSG